MPGIRTILLPQCCSRAAWVICSGACPNADASPSRFANALRISLIRLDLFITTPHSSISYLFARIFFGSFFQDISWGKVREKTFKYRKKSNLCRKEEKSAGWGVVVFFTKGLFWILFYFFFYFLSKSDQMFFVIGHVFFIFCTYSRKNIIFKEQ